MKKGIVFAPAVIGELLEVIHNALLVIDSNHQIIFANSRTAEMFNMEADILLGKQFSSLFMPDDIDILVENILLITRNDNEIESEAMFLKNDGSTFFGHISGTCFDWNENQKGMVFSIHDISDMKEIEQSLKRSERIVFLGRLVDDISHQIRNPIVAIGGLARRLQASHGDSDNVGIILSEASRLEKLLNTMNRFARLPAPTTQKIPFSDFVKELDIVMEAKLKKRGSRWSCYCNNLLLGETLHIDQSLFFEAIADVVDNSCESYFDTSMGEKKLVKCEINPSKDDAFPFILTITDFGVGITEHAREHIFSHFYTDKTGHIGMGLTFARRIIEEQGGKVTIASRPGKGTTVKIHLIKERRRPLRTQRL